MQTITQSNPQMDIQLFADAFKKKGKLLYRWNRRSIHKLAREISPAYRDFVNRLLSNSKLLIDRCGGGECRPIEYGEIYSLKKRCKNKIKVDLSDPRTFAHELGHSVDFLFGELNSFSGNIVIYDGKTLNDIFHEEFNNHHKELYEFLMDEYRLNIDANIHKGAYDIFINNMPKYLTLCDTEEPKLRKKLQKELYECGFVEVYYQINTRKCFKVLEQKYVPIMDALSSMYDITGLYLMGHDLEYYKRYSARAVQEFFANVFADKILGNHTRYDNLIKLMPRSFDAFEKLFFMIYERIQNNKRFTDLPIKDTYLDEEVYQDKSEEEEEER